MSNQWSPMTRPRDRGWIVLALIAAVLVACIGQAYVREWMQ